MSWCYRRKSYMSAQAFLDGETTWHGLVQHRTCVFKNVYTKWSQHQREVVWYKRWAASHMLMWGIGDGYFIFNLKYTINFHKCSVGIWTELQYYVKNIVRYVYIALIRKFNKKNSKGYMSLNIYSIGEEP